MSAGAFDCGDLASAKFVFAGTDSLLLWLNFRQSWLGRGPVISMSDIPFGEMEEIHGKEVVTLGSCLRNGGTMIPSFFAAGEDTQSYVFSSVSLNIQSSLEHAEDRAGLEQIAQLSEAGLLPKAVNLLVKKAGHNLVTANIGRLLQGSCLPAEAKALPRVYAAMSSMRIEDSDGDTLDDVIDRAETRTAARLGLDREGEDPKAALEKIFPAVGLEAQRQLMDCMRSIGFARPVKARTFSLEDASLVPTGRNQEPWVLAQPGLRWRQASLVYEEAAAIYPQCEESMLRSLVGIEVLGGILEESLHLDFIRAVRECGRRLEIFSAKFTLATPPPMSREEMRMRGTAVPASGGEVDIVIFEPSTGRALLVECKHRNERVAEFSKNIADWTRNEVLKGNGICPVARFVAANVCKRDVFSVGEAYFKDGFVPAYAYEFVNVEALMRGLWKDPAGTMDMLWSAEERQKEASQTMLRTMPALAGEVARLEAASPFVRQARGDEEPEGGFAPFSR